MNGNYRICLTLLQYLHRTFQLQCRISVRSTQVILISLATVFGNYITPLAHSSFHFLLFLELTFSLPYQSRFIVNRVLTKHLVHSSSTLTFTQGSNHFTFSLALGSMFCSTHTPFFRFVITFSSEENHITVRNHVTLSHTIHPRRFIE